MEVLNYVDIEHYFIVPPNDIYTSPVDKTIYCEWNYKKKRLVMTILDPIVYIQEFSTDKYLRKGVWVSYIDEINRRVINQILYDFYEGRSIL